MYLASGGLISYTPSIECIIGWTTHKHCLSVLISLFLFQLRHAHVRKGTRLSSHVFPFWSEETWEQDYMYWSYKPRPNQPHASASMDHFQYCARWRKNLVTFWCATLFNGDHQICNWVDTRSLIPRPSHRPVFDHLQYAKWRGKVWSSLSCECLPR